MPKFKVTAVLKEYIDAVAVVEAIDEADAETKAEALDPNLFEQITSAHGLEFDEIVEVEEETETDD